MTVPPQKPELIARAQSTVDKITRNFKRGLITEEERYLSLIHIWQLKILQGGAPFVAKVELKQPIVQAIVEDLTDAQSAVIVNYCGLTVAQDTELRNCLLYTSRCV